MTRQRVERDDRRLARPARGAASADVTLDGATWLLGRPRWLVRVVTASGNVIDRRTVRGSLPEAERVAAALLEQHAAQEYAAEPVLRLRLVDEDGAR